jgi:hypothetical protein
VCQAASGQAQQNNEQEDMALQHGFPENSWPIS